MKQEEYMHTWLKDIYHFGLRNILAVLRTAGQTKRENREADEAILLYQTLRDMNLSKMVSQGWKTEPNIVRQDLEITFDLVLFCPQYLALSWLFS